MHSRSTSEASGSLHSASSSWQLPVRLTFLCAATVMDVACAPRALMEMGREGRGQGVKCVQERLNGGGEEGGANA